MENKQAIQQKLDKIEALVKEVRSLLNAKSEQQALSPKENRQPQQHQNPQRIDSQAPKVQQDHSAPAPVEPAAPVVTAPIVVPTPPVPTPIPVQTETPQPAPAPSLVPEVAPPHALEAVESAPVVSTAPTPPATVTEQPALQQQPAASVPSQAVQTTNETIVPTASAPVEQPATAPTDVSPLIPDGGEALPKPERISPVGMVGGFDGEFVTMETGKRYQVPPNYISKSMLVEGDMLKLLKEGDYNEFKLVEERPRQSLSGILTKKNNQWVVLTDKGEFRVVAAAIRFHNGEIGDKVEVLVPAEFGEKPPVWGAVKGITKLNPPKEGEENTPPQRQQYNNQQRQPGGAPRDRERNNRDQGQGTAPQAQPTQPARQFTPLARPIEHSQVPHVQPAVPTPATAPSSNPVPHTPLAHPVQNTPAPAPSAPVAQTPPMSTPVPMNAPVPEAGTPGTIIAAEIDPNVSGSSDETEIEIPDLR